MRKLLMVISLVFLICLTFGCQDKEAMAELEAMKAQKEIEERNKEFVHKVFEEWNKKNFNFFMEVYSPDYSYYSPPGNPNSMSREETIELMRMIFKAFPDLTFKVEESMAEGDKVMSILTTKGIHKGELQGIPATGKEVEVSMINIIRIKNGMIVEEWELNDSLSLMMQLGMELKPKETLS